MRPTARDREMFSATFGALGSLDAASMAAGLSTFRVRALERGASFLRAGEPATEVALVIEGLLREYFPLGHGSLGHGPLGRGPWGRGRESKATHERTKAFILPGQATGSLADLISGQPSRASIVVEQPARLLTARYAELQRLAARDPAWAAIGRAATERLLLSKSEREWELLALDAEGRYASFRARHPGLEAIVAARHVASYLGITPEHLSRLRRRLRERARARPSR